MSKNTKIIIGVVAGLLVLCMIACVAVALFTGLLGSRVAKQVSNSTTSDPQQLAQRQSEIADFSVPAGFQPDTSMSILGINMVVYKGATNKSYMFLMQMPAQVEINESTIQQFESQMERQTGRNISNIKTIDTKTMTLRDQPAQEIVQEGTDSDGNTFRQMMVIFSGKGGTAMLSIGGPASGWDQAAYDKMIESIH